MGPTRSPPFFDRIEKHEVLGQGGFGIVFRASVKTHIGTKQYALKILDPSPFVSDPVQAHARFHREAAALTRIQHRGIVEYVDATIDEEGHPCILMAYIDGSDIRSAAGNLELSERCKLVAEVLGALEFAHEHSIVHRDLKPTNILVRRSDQQPIIVDFGSAYILSESSENTLTTRAPGTAGYIAGYITRNPKNRTPKQDLYAVGVILYELIAGQLPMDPLKYLPLARIYPYLAPLDPVVRKALDAESDTFHSAEEFRQALLVAVKQIEISEDDIPF
jgi:serine/threonine protein kinase